MYIYTTTYSDSTSRKTTTTTIALPCKNKYKTCKRNGPPFTCDTNCGTCRMWCYPWHCGSRTRNWRERTCTPNPTSQPQQRQHPRQQQHHPLTTVALHYNNNSNNSHYHKVQSPPRCPPRIQQNTVPGSCHRPIIITITTTTTPLISARKFTN